MNATKEPASESAMNEAPATHRRLETRNNGAVQPGDLQGIATLVIQTRQAQRLLDGRPKRGDKARIVGLYHFSGLMRTIWVAANHDDPYADWYLVRVQERIEKTRTALDGLCQQTHKRLQSIPGIEVHVARSTSPVRVPLRFGTPYGYKGAYLIADFDQLMSAILTAQHIGLLTREGGRPLTTRGSRLIRRVFAIPLSWKPLAVTREDVQPNTQRAQRARAHMGDLPEDILAALDTFKSSGPSYTSIDAMMRREETLFETRVSVSNTI